MDTTRNKTAVKGFLSGGGELGQLVREYDWSRTPLGDTANWPQSLRTLTTTVLQAGFPMLLMWGPDLTHIYNDSFRESLGNDGKHPQALGAPAKEVWPEIWDTIGPMFQQVMEKGETVFHEDALIPIFRNGRMEEVYWTFSYSPARDENNEIEGILVVCSDTTRKVKSINAAFEARNQLALARDAAGLATWELNPRTGKFTANARLREWFGLGEDEELEMAVAIDAISERDRQRVSAAVARATQPGSDGIYESEYAVTNKLTGERRFIRSKGKALFNEAGVATHLSGTSQDVTAEVQARYYRLKMLTLVDNSVDLMSILELDGTNSYINKAGRKILGISEDADVRTIPISDFHTPEQLQFVESVIIPAVMNEGKWAGQFGIRNVTTGEIIPLFNNCHRIDDVETGEPVAVGAVMRDMRPDIQIRQELEARIRESTQDLERRNQELASSEERYHKMIEEVEDYAILLLDKDGNVQNWNRGAERIKGYKASEIIGKNFQIFYLPEDRAAKLPQRLIHQAAVTGKALHEGWRVRKDGTRFWGSIAITALHGANNEIIGFSKVTRDLTERKKAEDQIMQYTRDLEFQNQELEQFAYAAAHDMKEPLRKVRFYNSYLADNIGDVDPKLKEYLSRSVNAAIRMQRLIDDLLTYSHASGSNKHFEEVNLNDVVEQVINLHADTIAETGARIEFDELPTLPAIAFQVRQLFDNLIGNSIKYRHPERAPLICIDAEKVSSLPGGLQEIVSDSGWIKITVSDNGIGFNNTAAEKIFDLFQRLSPGTVHSGSGIGLAICKKIMQNHKGYILAEGKEGEGAKFTMYFPVERQPVI